MSATHDSAREIAVMRQVIIDGKEDRLRNEANLKALEAILTVGLKVEFGGGIRDEETIRIGRFKDDKITTLAVKDFAQIASGHGGGDYGLVHDLLQAVSRRDPSLLTSTIEASMESHLMGFAGEESRATNKVVETRIEAAV